MEPPPGINPEEMHQWTPPTEAELEERRLWQEELDALTADIEQLLLKFNQIELGANNAEVGSSSWDPRLASLDQKLNEEIAALDKKYQGMKEEVASLQPKLDQAGKDIQGLQQAQEARRFQPAHYQSAYVLFRDRKFSAAAQRFLQVMATRYPAHLRDNLLFGLGASYFKLGQWGKSVKYLTTLVSQETRGDKWHEGSLLLGLVYNRSGQKSQALYVLENAMKTNPPAVLKSLMENLIAHSQEGNGTSPS